ncbi:MAG: PAAR domain-containing protein, partial [Myxococcales bacterium]|nr:PAAR domain-containing protein [Myxococcales bacterium]
MPPAARVSDLSACPAHGGGPISTGCMSVHIGNCPAARVGDKIICGPTIDTIARGECSVLFGGAHAARLGDPTVHTGRIVVGCPTVLIGCV